MKKLPATYPTILIMALGFVAFYFLFGQLVFIYISTALLSISLLSKKVADKIVWAWMKLALVLGYINSRILLTFTFYLILAPLAIVYRITGNDSLQLKGKKTTYYTERNHTYVPKDLEKPY